MLPFLKPKKMASTIMMTHKAAGGPVEEHEEGEEVHGLMVAAEDLISAVHSKDSKAVADSLRAAFELLDEEPHEEVPHISEGEE